MWEKDDDACEDYLNRAFEEYGKVLAATVRWKESKTWALVSFATAVEARSAIAASPLKPSQMVVSQFDQDTASISLGKMGETLREHQQKTTETLNESPSKDALRTPTLDHEAEVNGAVSDQRPAKRRPRKVTRGRSGSTRVLHRSVDDVSSHHECRLQLSGHFVNYRSITVNCQTRDTLRTVKEQLAKKLSITELAITGEITSLDDVVFPAPQQDVHGTQSQWGPWKPFVCVVLVSYMATPYMTSLPAVWAELATEESAASLEWAVQVAAGSVVLLLVGLFCWCVWYLRCNLYSGQLKINSADLVDRRKKTLLELFSHVDADARDMTRTTSVSLCTLKLVRFGCPLDENMTVGRCGVNSDCTNSKGEQHRIGEICKKCCMTIGSDEDGLGDQARVAFLVHDGQDSSAALRAGQAALRSELEGLTQRALFARAVESLDKADLELARRSVEPKTELISLICDAWATNAGAATAGNDQTTEPGKRKTVTAINLPTDVKDALKSAGLYAEPTDHVQTVNDHQDHDMLLWSCAIVDEPLAKVFWERSRRPVYAALVASAVCDGLSKTQLHDNDSSIDEKYGPKLQYLAKTFKGYADEMISHTIHDENSKLLGNGWNEGRQDSDDALAGAIVQMAFMQLDTDDATKAESAHTKSKHTHPALESQVQVLWESKDSNFAFAMNAVLWLFFLLLLLTYVNSVIMSASEEFADVPNWLRFAFITWCMALTTETTVKHLSRGKRQPSASASSVFFYMHVIVLSVCHVAWMLEICSTQAPLFEWMFGVPIFKSLVRGLLPILLRFACLLAFLRILNILSVWSGVRGVVNMFIQIMLAPDNISFLLMLMTLAASFGVAINGVAVRKSFTPCSLIDHTLTCLLLDLFVLKVAAIGITQVSTTPAFNVTPAVLVNNSVIDSVFFGFGRWSDLVTDALDFEAPEHMDSSAVVYFYAFLLFANTYLVEGFLIGMINDIFAEKATTADLKMDWRINEIRDSQCTKIDGTHFIFSFPPFNLISLIPELYSGLSFTRLGLDSRSQSFVVRFKLTVVGHCFVFCACDYFLTLGTECWLCVHVAVCLQQRMLQQHDIQLSDLQTVQAAEHMFFVSRLALFVVFYTLSFAFGPVVRF